MTLSMVEGSGSRFDRFDRLTALRPSKGRLTAPRKIEGKTAERRAKNRRAEAYLGRTLERLRLERE